jgi:hypothetical protein
MTSFYFQRTVRDVNTSLELYTFVWLLEFDYWILFGYCPPICCKQIGEVSSNSLNLTDILELDYFYQS